VVLVDTCYGRINQHTLYDEKGRLIARAVLKDYKKAGTSRDKKSDPSQEVTLPHRIDLDWPQARLSLTIRLKTVEVNPVSIGEQTWQLPVVRDYPQFDMGARLGRNRLSGGDRDDLSIHPVLDQARQPTYPARFVRTAEAEEPPWETEGDVPETRRPRRRPAWWLPRLFRRR
jgi:hypothetical protein